MKNNCLRVIAVCCLCVLPLSTHANELDNVAACAGMIIGNGAVDFINGHEQAFDDATEVAYSGYVGLASSQKYPTSELQIADQIMASNIDKITQAANTSTYTTDTYEEVVSCYRKMSLIILRNSNWIKERGDFINKLKSGSLDRMKRLLKAG